jgi:polysaccharide biosynthesis/export protein
LRIFAKKQILMPKKIAIVLAIICAYLGSMAQNATDSLQVTPVAPAAVMAQEVASLPPDTVSYRIKPGDRLRIRNLNSLSIILPELSNMAVAGAQVSAQGSNGAVFETYVTRTGQIALPQVGLVKVAGLTRAEAVLEIEHSYANVLNKAIFDLEILNLRIKVLGAVGKQGVILLENEKLTLGEVIALAGGIDFATADKTIKLVRSRNNSQQEINFDIRDLNDPKITNTLVFDGDYVFVPPSKASLRNIKNQRTSSILQPIALTLNALAVIVGLYFTYRASLPKGP